MSATDSKETGITDFELDERQTVRLIYSRP